MKYYLNGKQAQILDRYTQEEIGIPGIVLMERAAEKLADAVQDVAGSRNDRILAVVESGNNGGDGVAAARILRTRGYDTYIYEIGGIASRSDSYIRQVEIARRLGVSFVTSDDFRGYDIIIDGIFGVGLSRDVKGIHSEVIDKLNSLRDKGTVKVISVDIPSGISADTGHILGNAIQSDITVTFEYAKLGMLIDRGRDYSGDVITADIGIYHPDTIDDMRRAIGMYDSEDAIYYEYTSDDMARYIPERRGDSNKGTYGKTLIVAGSRDVYGAVYLAAEACYRVGTGLVKVVTDIRNRDILSEKLSEAMMLTYDSDIEVATFLESYADAIKWADTILIGPGIGTGDIARRLMEIIRGEVTVGQNLILDADALNIISKGEGIDYLKSISDKIGRERVVITPHLMEMSRLNGKSVSEIKDSKGLVASEVSHHAGVITVLKDDRTVVTSSDEGCIRDAIYINTTGNNGMSTGGSGDVLAGIIAGLMSQNRDKAIHDHDLVCAAVRLHGLAGDRARDGKGERGMLASDIIESLTNIICDF